MMANLFKIFSKIEFPNHDPFVFNFEIFKTTSLTVSKNDPHIIINGFRKDF